MIRGEKPKVKKKVKFTDDVNIMFPEIRDIVYNEPTKDEGNKIELSILNVKTIFPGLNKGNIPQELKFFKSRNELLNEALKRFGYLNASDHPFLNYVSSSSGQDLLQRNKIKIDLERSDVLMIIIFYQLKKIIQSLAWKLNMLD